MGACPACGSGNQPAAPAHMAGPPPSKARLPPPSTGRSPIQANVPPTGANSTKSAPARLSKRSTKSDGITRSQLILDNPGKIRDIYDVDSKKLGEGTFGFVSKGTHKTTNVVRAVKSICKGHMKNVGRFKQEIEIMKRMDHPNIIKLFETFQDQRNVYLVMELCSGGELFDRIIKVGHFVESDGAIVVKHILRALFYMHENHIAHRDLKPENFLFLTNGPIANNTLKIIDFGLSCPCEPGQTMSTRAGTPFYVAPQVLSGKYDHMCDLWSCGVIMYTLLCGYPPFHGKTDQDVFAMVRAGKFSFDAKDWKNRSGDSKHLITMLLKKDAKDRYTAEQALNDVWITETAPRAEQVSLQDGFVDNLRGFHFQNKLRKAALQIIAGQLTEPQIQELHDTFMALDGNGDGLLSLAELRDGLKNAGLKKIPSDLEQIMESVDADGSGVIDYTEFLAASMNQKSYLQEDVCWTAFSVFDLNGDGRISQQELADVLHNGSVDEIVGSQSAADILNEVDKNGDGSIDFDEFMGMMRKVHLCGRQPHDGHHSLERSPGAAGSSFRALGGA